MSFAGSYIYGLRAIIDHKGKKITHGHFVAKIKIMTDWFEFDDSSVKKIATPGMIGKNTPKE